MKEKINKHKYKDKDKLSLVFLIIGINLIILKGILPEIIDKNGILNEPFYLLPIGFSFIIISIVTYICKYIFKKIKRQK